MKIIIIGNGIAANSAATVIREHDRESNITMLSDENQFFYARPRLTEFISGKSAFEKILIHDEAWYKKNNIELLKGLSVSSIDTEHQVLYGSFGSLSYDELLIASGASPSFPPFFRPQLEKVYALRTKEQADHIIATAQHSESAAIIGGGLLGIDTAFALVERGMDTTIIEFYGWLLPKQLDQDSAAILRDLLSQKRLKFLFGKQTASISNEKNGLTLAFADGTSILADMAIISAGVRSNIAFLKGTKVATGRGITIDHQMRTNVPHIYAAGDCSEFEGKMYGVWSAAKEQGEIAGLAMIGQDVDYQGSVIGARIKAAGIDVASIGDFSMTPSTTVEVFHEKDIFKKYFREGNKLKGAILIGDTSDYFKLQKEIAG